MSHDIFPSARHDSPALGTSNHWMPVRTSYRGTFFGTTTLISKQLHPFKDKRLGEALWVLKTISPRCDANLGRLSRY